MNGGSFSPPHATHQEGRDVDGDAPWYDARTAAVADRFLAVLRSPNGPSIERILVTFNAPGTTNRLRCENGAIDADHGQFWNRIQNVRVPAAGGGTRPATNVVRPVASHCVHFHVQFFRP